MSELQINPQVVINNLQNKLSDAEMRETFAQAQVAAVQEQLESLEKEAQQVISDLNDRIRELEERLETPATIEGEVE